MCFSGKRKRVKKIKLVLNLSLKFSGVIKPVSLSSWLSVLGLVLGVSTLVLSLALVDSYEKAFKKGIFSVYSHLRLRVDDQSEELESIKSRVSKVYNKEFHVSPISIKESLLAHKGSVAGVSLIGIDIKSINTVIDLKDKIIKGKYFSKNTVAKSEVIIGKGIQESFNLNVGDKFSVVIPIRSYDESKQFARKILRLRVRAVVDFGTYDYNKRFLMLSKTLVNEVLDQPKNYFSEVRIKLKNADDVIEFQKSWTKLWPSRDYISNWKDESGGLIEAIEIEKIVIFFLVLIMVVVAAFNVSTNLFLNLSKRQRDFSILRTVGLRKKDIALMLSLNGLLLGAIGLFFGFILAFLIKGVLNYILSKGYFLPPEVYKLTSLSISFDGTELFVVAIATLSLCFISALAPALGISRQTVVEGINYD